MEVLGLAQVSMAEEILRHDDTPGLSEQPAEPSAKKGRKKRVTEVDSQDAEATESRAQKLQTKKPKPGPASYPLTRSDVARLLTNPELAAQRSCKAHTIRKLVVFGSLAVRQGVFDLMRLDVKHFAIVNKGKTYTSPDSPGEYVLFTPGGAAGDAGGWAGIPQLFFANPKNPVLCPVKVLEDERRLRPKDAKSGAFFLTLGRNDKKYW